MEDTREGQQLEVGRQEGEVPTFVLLPQGEGHIPNTGNWTHLWGHQADVLHYLQYVSRSYSTFELGLFTHDVISITLNDREQRKHQIV